MSLFLGILLVFLNVLDCITTYIGCKVHHVKELNPIGHWLFVHIGIIPSLVIKLLLAIGIVVLFILIGMWQTLLVLVVFYVILVVWNFYRLYCIRRDKKDGRQSY